MRISLHRAAGLMLAGGVAAGPAHAAKAPHCDGLAPTPGVTVRDGVIKGTPRNDVIVGTPGDDTIFGLEGDDVICGGGGDDNIAGGEGDDLLDGGPGRDELSGDQGQDRLLGGPGKDYLYGDDGPDHLSGGDGNDMLHGGEGADDMHGGRGGDELFGDGGKDLLNGGRDKKRDRLHHDPEDPRTGNNDPNDLCFLRSDEDGPAEAPIHCGQEPGDRHTSEPDSGFPEAREPHAEQPRQLDV